MEKTVEIPQQQDEFRQDASQVAQLAAEENALVPYVPKSSAPFKMETLIPRNMAFEVQKALNTIVKEKGNIDQYVRDKLQYTTTTALWKALAAEQVDTLALYLKQFDRGQGIIVADQTGIGKGRQAAAIIRHAVKNGYLPIFFTKKPALFSDMYRDLKAIGFSDIHPFIVNTDSKAKIKDADGSVVFSPLSVAAQQALLTAEEVHDVESPTAISYFKRNGIAMPNPEETPTITVKKSIDHLPTAYDMVFCTYSQVQSAHPYKRDWIEQLCLNGVEGSKKYKKVIFILDESHMAGGYDSIIGEWMRSVLPYTEACCFLSATFAKYPEVMPFYAKKTAIMETGVGDGNFVSSMIAGGLALQEVVASNLAESGQLIRRQRSNEGITIDYVVLNEEPQRSMHRKSVNRIIKLMNRVVEFEATYITPELDLLHKQAKVMGELVKKKPRALGVKSAPFFSRVFNIVDQMLFALKVQDTARITLELLAQNKKVVIAFKSTMGTFLKDLNVSSGDVIPLEELDFVRAMIKSLDGVFNYNYTSIDGTKSRQRLQLEELSDSAIAAYKDIKKAMLSEATGLMVSPIDQLIDIVSHTKKPSSVGGHDGEYYRVAEVTGRNQKVYFEGDDAVVASFRSDAEKSFRLFNSGEYDVLLINQSGSTGFSAHSSKDFKDQRQRHMLIPQFELDVNTMVQLLGRVNRTSQVNLPSYSFITSDIPMEVRLMTMMKAKLKSLDANTTGSQNTNEDTLKSEDFLNKYGDKVAWQWVDENEQYLPQMGYPTYHRKYDSKTGTSYYERNDTKEGAARQLTGRAGLLEVTDQEKLYKELLAMYNQQIVIEKQEGTYDLETEFLQLDADVKKRFLFQKGRGGHTPFGKDTIREVSIVNNLKRPLTKTEIDTRIAIQLDGKTSKEVQQGLIDEIEKEYPKLIEKRKAKKTASIAKIRKELESLPALGSGKDEKENDKIASKHEKLTESLEEATNALQNLVGGLERIKTIILRAIEAFEVGTLVKIPKTGSITDPSWGVFLGISIGSAASNPYTLSNIRMRFAVADQRKIVTYSLVEEQQDFINRIYQESRDISDGERESIPEVWNDLIKQASSKRQKRHILTENIVLASAEIGSKNRLIKYNTNLGTIKNGILMSADFGKDGEHIALLPISSALKVIEALAIDTTFKDHTHTIKFKRISEGYFQVFMKKKEHYKLGIDPKLRQLIRSAAGQAADELPDFVQNAGDMTGALAIKNLVPFLEVLDGYGIQIEGEAKELEDWELENKSEWADRTTGNNERWKYELGRAYGQGSNPLSGFVAYEEPTKDYPFGSVLYDRKLSDKEKYSFSLIPIFKNVAIPYLRWKNTLQPTPIFREFQELVVASNTLPIHEVQDALGYFITNHPHEDGNAAFVFGRFSSQQLGLAAYEDMIAAITPMEAVLDKLRIYHKQSSSQIDKRKKYN